MSYSFLSYIWQIRSILLPIRKIATYAVHMASSTLPLAEALRGEFWQNNFLAGEGSFTYFAVFAMLEICPYSKSKEFSSKGAGM